MMSWLEKNKQMIPLIVMISLFTAMGLIAWFAIRPAHGYIKEKADAIQEYYAFRENRERQIKRLPDLEKQFRHILDQEATIGILSSEDRIVDFITTLERLASDTSVHIEIQSKDSKGIVEKQKATRSSGTQDKDTESSPASKKKEAKLVDSLPYDRTLPIDVVVIGDYKEIADFLYKMETLPYGLDVVALSVKKRDAEEVLTRPISPGNNPFQIFGVGEAPLPTEDKEFIPGTLEATFETMVYISK